jgi:hypothetical protein
MRHAVFILGAPGVGKTELTRGLLGSNTHIDGRWTVGKQFAAAGPYMGNVFDGPDALPYSVHVVRAMLSEFAWKSLPCIFDGERFCAWVVRELKGQATCLAIRLTAPVELLQQRRAKRGSPPATNAWLDAKDAQACVVASLCSRVVNLDASQPARTVLADAHKVLYREGVL